MNLNKKILLLLAVVLLAMPLAATGPKEFSIELGSMANSFLVLDQLLSDKHYDLGQYYNFAGINLGFGHPIGDDWQMQYAAQIAVIGSLPLIKVGVSREFDLGAGCTFEPRLYAVGGATPEIFMGTYPTFGAEALGRFNFYLGENFRLFTGLGFTGVGVLDLYYDVWNFRWAIPLELGISVLK